jgi:cytochrome c2
MGMPANIWVASDEKWGPRPMQIKKILTIVCVVALGSPAVSGALVDAVKAGDTELVARLLDEGADVNDADNFGTALHYASLKGLAPVAELLLSRGADQNLNFDMLGTPLHLAARMDHAAVVSVLVDGGADVEALNSRSLTSLHVAVMEGRTASTQALIEAGADVNAIGIPATGVVADGETSALHLARRLEHTEIADLLTAAGAVPRSIEKVDITLGDPVRGREVAQTYCRECHALEAGDSAPLQVGAGPPLIGVVNRSVADLPGFEYSAALIDFGGSWTADRLFSFARYPMLTVPGTKMTSAQQTNDQERIDLTNYLMTKD